MGDFEIKSLNVEDESKAKLAQCKKIHDEIRKTLVKELNSNGYSYPESEDFYVSGVFIDAPEAGVLEELCEYAAAQGNTDYDGSWKAENIFSLLKDKTVKYEMGSSFQISFGFGGLPPVLTVLSFLSVYSKIQFLKVSFTRDKWETRGDYSSKNRVEIQFENGEFMIGKPRKNKAKAVKKQTVKNGKGEGFKSNMIIPSRLERSKEYDVEKLSDTEYKATSKDKEHKVIERDGYFWCDCQDFLKEPKNCKHIIAVKRFMDDPVVLSAETFNS